MKRYTVAALLAGALGCTESNAPSPPAVPPPVPPPPPPAASFAIRPALDTALLNDPPNDRVWFVAERADSTVDLWTVSDSSIAQVYPRERGQALVFARRPGTVTITARRGGDSGQATLVIPAPIIPPVPPFAITPTLDTITIGQQVTFQANRSSIQWSSSDSSLARLDERPLQHLAPVVGIGAGTVTITASQQGDTAHATLVIREPQPGEWEAIELNRLDADAGSAVAINDDGIIVGRLEGPGDRMRGFIYKDGAMHILPGSGGRDAPVAISPSGKIAGIAYGDTSRVVVWDMWDAAPRWLNHQRLENVIGINDRGDVLEQTWFANHEYSPQYRAVLWRDNVPVDLGDLGDSTVTHPVAYAKAWNSRGQIVGWSNVSEVAVYTDTRVGVAHAFIWENGVMRDLGVLAPRPCTGVATPADCSWGMATGINASGVVVGAASAAENRTRAFIWENGVMRDLGVAPGHFTTARAINDRGQVLGMDGVDGTTFLWENGQTQIIGAGYATVLGPNGEVVLGNAIWEAGRLSDLGEGTVTAINSHGEAVGSSGKRVMLWRKKR